MKACLQIAECRFIFCKDTRKKSQRQISLRLFLFLALLTQLSQMGKLKKLKKLEKLEKLEKLKPNALQINLQPKMLLAITSNDRRE